MATTLALLVGGNPLPNYVVAKYHFQGNNGLEIPSTVILVLTERTANSEVHKNLEAAIKKLFTLQQTNICIVEWRPTDSPATLADKFRQMHRPNDTFHLNYTGGTKQMAVCAVEAVELIKTKVEFISYLNATSHTLHFEGCSLAATGDLRNKINLTLDELLQLHDFQIKEAKQQVAANGIYEKVSEFLRVLASDEDDNRSEFCAFRRKVALKLLLNESLNSSDIPSGISNVLPFSMWGNSDKKFLTGGWLVDAILLQFIKIKDQLEPALSDFAAQIETNRGGNFDLLLLQGYHLTLVGCMALGCDNDEDLDGRLQAKAFELVQRAQQLGGEEARAILVTLAEKRRIRPIEENVNVSFVASDKTIKILPYDCLQSNSLANSLKNFLK